MCAAKPIQGAIGASNRPVYIAADGTITPIAGAIGGATQPIYVNGSGQLVAGNTPIYTVPESMKFPNFSSTISISGRITVDIKRDTSNRVPLSGSQTQSLSLITSVDNVLKYNTDYSVAQDCFLKFHTYMHAFKATACGINLLINGYHAFSYKENDSFKAGVDSDITLNEDTSSSDFCAPMSARWAVTTIAAVYVKAGTTFKVSPSKTGVRVINADGKITGDVAATGVGSWLNHDNLDKYVQGGSAASLNSVDLAVAVFNSGFININNCKITQESYDGAGHNAILAAQSRMLLPVVCIAHPLY